NPTNQANTMTVQPPAGQNNPTSAAAGLVSLSWSATPTAPGAGHTLTYLVLRGPVGGPYAQIGTTTSLAYSDTPSADGSYGYVIQAQVAGGGTFTSGNSAAKTGLSDRLAPTTSITCNAGSCAGWFDATVSVTVAGVDGGSGMGSVTRNVDGAGQTSTAGASATFNVSGENAAHTVAYFGTDGAGNASTTANQTVKIDLTAPTVATALTSATGAAGAPVTVDLTWTAGTDALSGLSGYEVRWTGNVAACPAANTTNYPNSATVGAVTAYSISGLVSGDKHCAYLVTIDNAGNRSANSAITGPTKAK
ncbi:MAG TPA: hypothetical protein VGK15_04400, partial [Candidatus Limnocylindria bacterium]